MNIETTYAEDTGEYFLVSLKKNDKEVHFIMHKESCEWGLLCQTDETGKEYTDNWKGTEWAADRLNLDAYGFWTDITPILQNAIDSI